MDKPLPQPTPTTQPFWDGLRERKIRMQFSPSGDRWTFYPRVLMPGTLADDLEWREVSGLGTLYSFTIARRPTAPHWADSLPQLLAIVELDEGPRVTTEIVNVEPDDIRVGMRLQPVFADQPGSDVTLLFYEPVEGEPTR
jgi:uncharacterized OB-fold protein